MAQSLIETLQSFISLTLGGLSFLVGYLLILARASSQAPRTTALPDQEPDCRFLILIPAHNEERLLGATLDSLAAVDYPSDRYAIHVVADNCTDRTREIALARGVEVHVRQDLTQVGKGYALQWLLNHIWEAEIPHDALIFFDADSVVSPNFLRVMAARLERGERVIQAYYAVCQPEKSWNGSLRFAAFAVLHYLRPQARMALGGSAGLKGNGMVFSAEVMKRYPWSASLTEDIELHMKLLLDGERVTFAPDAVVWAEMPNTFTGMRSQHLRWERGRMQMARSYVPSLMKASYRAARSKSPQKAFRYFDAAMEHILPPFSVLVSLTTLCLAASLALGGLAGIGPRRQPVRRLSSLKKRGGFNVLLSVGLLVGQVIYLLTGLRQVQAPRSIYLSLLYAPFLIVWKLGQYIEAFFSQSQTGWVRTARNRER